MNVCMSKYCIGQSQVSMYFNKGIKLVNSIFIISLNIFALNSIVAKEPKDYLLANQIALELYHRQAHLADQEILLKLKEIKDVIANEVFLNIPKTTYQDFDPNLLINTFCLLRLVDLNTNKCKQVKQNILRNNIHRLHYTELARVSLLVFSSDNMQKLVKTYADAQLSICQRGLVSDMHDTLLKVEQLHRPLASRFIKQLLIHVKRRDSINDLKAIEKIEAVTGFIKKFYNVNPYERYIVAAYNKSFRFGCTTYILNPLNTLMATYETLGLDRHNMERFRDIIWLYDLCSNLPESIDNIATIGQIQNKTKEIYMPTLSNSDISR